MLDDEKKSTTNRRLRVRIDRVLSRGVEWWRAVVAALAVVGSYGGVSSGRLASRMVFTICACSPSSGTCLRKNQSGVLLGGTGSQTFGLSVKNIPEASLGRYGNWSDLDRTAFGGNG